MTTFQIGTQQPLTSTTPATSLVPGALVNLYTDANYQCGPNAFSAPDGITPLAVPAPDFGADLMVELLIGHDTSDDCIIRLIRVVENPDDPSHPFGRYVQWGVNPDPSMAFTSLPISDSLDAFDRQDATISEAFQLTLRPFNGDGQRFYALATGPDGNLYYMLSSVPQGTPATTAIGTVLFIEAGISPPARSTVFGGTTYSPVWWIDIVSTSVEDRIHTSPPPAKHGDPKPSPSKTPIPVSPSGQWNPKNTSNKSQTFPGGKFTYEADETTEASFHWDVSLKVESDSKFDVGVVSENVKVTVGTDVGGSSKNTHTEKVSLSLDVPKVKVPPQKQCLLHVDLNEETIEQGFLMDVTRTVQRSGVAQAYTIPIKILGSVAATRPTLSGDLWGDPFPVNAM